MTDQKSDQRLVDRLREGDEDAFSELIDCFHQSMIRLAAVFVSDDDLAEEIVQETWLAVIDGIDNFEGRSSIKTWLFAILSNKARKRGKRDARMKPWSAIFESSIDEEVHPMSDRFDSRGRWAKPPAAWAVGPEEKMVKDDLLRVIKASIEELPPSQRAVVRLRDVEGLSASETCEVLDLSDGNQRVLLHRGRVKVREDVETYMEQTS
ncbi:MAG: RNA polymerase sigma factor [Myxococcota bacterium]